MISRSYFVLTSSICTYLFSLTTAEASELLQDFAAIPKWTVPPTYLELCAYPRRRFEEIASRLLAFYLQPTAPHGLGDLFLASLLRLVAPTHHYNTTARDIHVAREVAATGTRLDILISSAEFALGIENKLTAKLYNPLGLYGQRIELAHPRNFHKVVLSVTAIRDPAEKQLLLDHDFENITYATLFQALRPGLAALIPSQYTLFVADFMQTIDNLVTPPTLSTDLSVFCFNNATQLTELTQIYQRYKDQVFAEQKKQIALLKPLIEERTQPTNWWIYEGYSLGCKELNVQRPNVGIESWFVATQQDALGCFHIQLRGWGLADWNYYEAALLAEFGFAEATRNPDGASLVVYSCPCLPTDMTLLDQLTQVYERSARVLNTLVGHPTAPA